MNRLLGLLLLAALDMPPALAGAVIFDVNNPQDLPDADPGNGVCSVSPFLDPDTFALCTLRAAVMEANATAPEYDDIVMILLTPGSEHVFQIEPEEGDLTGENGDLDIARPMWIGVPPGSQTRATISGNHLDKIFEIGEYADGSTLFGLEITHGTVIAGIEGNAAAIESEAEDLGLHWLDVNENYADVYNNGAIYLYFGSMHLTDSSVRNNGNEEHWMSGIEAANPSEEWTIERSTISGNSGPGVGHRYGQLSVVASTIAENMRCGIVSQHILEVRESTIVGNGSCQILSDMFDNFDTQISGSIIASPEPTVPACKFTSEANLIGSGWNLYGDDSCNPGDLADVTSKYNASIALKPLGHWGGPTATMPPLPDSEAVDFADASACDADAVDQRGLPRLVAYHGEPARCDAGAVELQVERIFADGFDAAP